MSIKTHVRHVHLLGVLGVFCLLGAAVPQAQREAPFNPLPLAKTLKCTFPIYVITNWENGEPLPAVRKPGAILAFQIDQIDTQESSARLVSTSGVGHLTAQLAGSSLHLMDIRPSGSLTITTVFAQESGDKKLKAVHTRANYLPISLPGFVSQPEVTQHYGECEIVS